MIDYDVLRRFKETSKKSEQRIRGNLIRQSERGIDK